MFRNAAAYVLFAAGDYLEITGSRLCLAAGKLLRPTEPEPWLYGPNGQVDIYLDGEPLATVREN